MAYHLEPFYKQRDSLVIFVTWNGGGLQCEANEVEIAYIQPGKPNQNEFIERFNRSYLTEVLDPHLFSNLEQIRELSWGWMISYNEERPHESLGNLPLSEFKQRLAA